MTEPMPAAPGVEWRKVVAAVLGATAAATWSFTIVIVFDDHPGRPIYEVLVSVGGLVVLGFLRYVRRPDDEDSRIVAATSLLVAAGAGLGLVIGYALADRETAAVAVAGLVAFVAGGVLAVAAVALWVADPRTRLAITAVVLELAIVVAVLITGTLLRDPWRTGVIVAGIVALLATTILGFRSAVGSRRG